MRPPAEPRESVGKPAARTSIGLAQRFARHASPLTTIVYTHPADEELWEGVRQLPC